MRFAKEAGANLRDEVRPAPADHSAASMGGISEVGPHAFEPLRRLFNRGRCRCCYEPASRHPLRGWTRARPIPEPRLWALWRRLGLMP